MQSRQVGAGAARAHDLLAQCLAGAEHTDTGDFSAQRIALVIHAAGGLAILLLATTLSVFTPWGKTKHGKGDANARKRHVIIGIVGVLLVLAIFHLAGGAPRH